MKMENFFPLFVLDRKKLGMLLRTFVDLFADQKLILSLFFFASPHED